MTTTPQEIQLKPTASTWGEKERFIEQNCGKWLGDGAYADVYEDKHNKNRVWKISKSPDAGYLTYLKKLVLDNEDNPHVPKVYNFIKFMKDRKLGFYCLNIEKLRELPYRTYQTRIAKVARTITAKRRLPYKETISLIEKEAFWGLEKIQKEKLLKLITPQFVSTCNAITKIIKTNPSRGLDMHEGNFMLRRGVPVITDPIT